MNHRKIVYHTSSNLAQPVANDPWVISDGGSGYYYCWSGDGIYIAHAKDLTGIPDYQSHSRRVWAPPANSAYSHNIWAPELHCIDGKWYVYFAADDGENKNHRMYVLSCISDDPMGDYRFEGQITDESNKWAIDGTVMQFEGQCYFIWSGWEGDENVCQHLYIAHMSSPTSIDSSRVRISSPELDFELHGGSPKINEGPFALIRDGRAYLIYSASGSWCDDYCLGLLTLEGSDPLSPDAWVKSAQPILHKSEGSYGPGHASLAYAPDGRLWIFYHANLVSGSSWHGRGLRMHPVEARDGILDIGPAPSPNAPIQIPVWADPEEA